jgi:hypothetical protein
VRGVKSQIKERHKVCIALCMKNLLENQTAYFLILAGSILSAFFLAMVLRIDILAPLVWLISCLKLIIYIIYYYTQFGVVTDLLLLAVLFCVTKFVINLIDKFINMVSNQIANDKEIE